VPGSTPGSWLEFLEKYRFRSFVDIGGERVDLAEVAVECARRRSLKPWYDLLLPRVVGEARRRGLVGSVKVSELVEKGKLTVRNTGSVDVDIASLLLPYLPPDFTITREVYDPDRGLAVHAQFNIRCSDVMVWILLDGLAVKFTGAVGVGISAIAAPIDKWAMRLRRPRTVAEMVEEAIARAEEKVEMVFRAENIAEEKKD